MQPLISNSCEEFAVTLRILRDHLTNLIKTYKSKTRLEIKNTGLGGEELLNISNFLKTLQRDLKKSKRRTKGDTQKSQTIQKTKNKKAQENRKNQCKDLEKHKNIRLQDESDTGNKNIVERVVQKWLVFFEKNLKRIANLDQKTCKKKTMQ